MWDAIAKQIHHVTGIPFSICDRISVGGGSINQAYRISDEQQTYFVKLNQASRVGMFEAEAMGLQEMAAARSIFVPQPICWGTSFGHSYLVLAWMALGRGTESAWAEMGRQLANLHRTASAQGFGWQRDNTIGDTPQLNPWTPDWTTFFLESRIDYQLQLARRKGGNFPQADALLKSIPLLLAGYHPTSSLVHGDLWSGNAAFQSSGAPVVFDPAVYYGDREVDLAMTELFGGFPNPFYQGYQNTWPVTVGYQQRKVLYNLYHILNHFNLFGGSYAHQAGQMMEQVIAMVR